MIKTLAEHDKEVVPTDKTNSFRLMTTSDCKEEIDRHLQERATKVPREKLVEMRRPSLRHNRKLRKLRAIS